MEQIDYSRMTDQELLVEVKKMKIFSLNNALLIGFSVGIVFFSIGKSSWGLLTLIPLFFTYKMINDTRNKRAKELENVVKESNIKKSF